MTDAIAHDRPAALATLACAVVELGWMPRRAHTIMDMNVQFYPNSPLRQEILAAIGAPAESPSPARAGEGRVEGPRKGTAA